MNPDRLQKILQDLLASSSKSKDDYISVCDELGEVSIIFYAEEETAKYFQVSLEAPSLPRLLG